MKRIFSFIFIILTCIVLFSNTIKADEPQEYDSFTDGFKFIINDDGDKTCTITGYDSAVYTNIIPEELNGYVVTRIGNGAFKDMPQIAGELSFPNTIISIGEEAFSGCTYLTRVNLPSSVKEVGSRAFYQCTSLERVNLNRVEIIGDAVFYKCTGFENKNIIIPDSVKEIGQRVFAFSNIESVEFTGKNSPVVDENIFRFYEGKVIIPSDRNWYTGSVWSGSDVKGVELTGDLNKDNMVNSDDAAIALDLYRYGNISKEDIDIGDINRDNVINSDDAALILDIYRYGK